MQKFRKIVINLCVIVAAVLAAWGSRALFAPILGDLSFITFFPMIFAIAWWGGLLPTLVATVISSFLLAYFILEPNNSLAIATVEHRYGVMLYIAISLAAGWMGEQLHRARRDAIQAANDALSEHERLKVTLSSIGDAVIVTDESGRIMSMNPVAELLTEWDEHEAVGKPLAAVFQIVNENTREPIENLYAKVSRTSVVVSHANHTVLIGKRGTERPIDDSAAPIKDLSGKILGVVIVFRDVSTKRHSEQALARSQRELSDFFDNAAIPLNSVGADGVILRANQAELDMLGYASDEYLGHHLAEFYVDRDVIDDILAKQLRGEVVHNYEARLRCKDGSIRDVLVTSSALWENGRFVQTRCFTRDITDRKLAEEALAFFAKASTTLAALVDRESALQQSARIAVPYLADWCVVYVVDEAGVIDYHAHAHHDPEKERLLTQMLTQSPLDWSSNTATVRALKTGQSQLMPELPEEFLDSVAQGESHRQYIRELGPRGVISVPLKIRERTIGVIGLVNCNPTRRYTEREVYLAENLAERIATAVDNSRLYHAVTEASRQKDEFLAMLAHELRNPLAAIRYAVALGQLGKGDPDGELFSIIDRQTKSLAHLIDDLLDVSRISRDKVTLRKEAIDVATVVHRAVATVRSVFEQKNHELVLDIINEAMVVHADPTRAEQIVANLLTNACKYTREGGRITVHVERNGKDAIIEVADTGVGMSPEILGRVFDLFAQADRTLDRSEGGLGIGLTVARKLVEMHGGAIAASSPGVGQGSTFTVRLPLSDMSVVAVSPFATEQRVSQSQTFRVLVVDDNPDTVISCAKLLQLLGHQVQSASDGLSALKVAQDFQPQVLLLDIGLPGMNGYDVARELRSSGFQDALIVAISGYGQPDDRHRSEEAGFDVHLVKPIDQVALNAVLNRARIGQPPKF